MAKEKKAERGFDEILGELQGEVDRLERGELPLEEALATFERGVALSREGEKLLEQAEERVEQLLATADGDELVPLDDPDGA